MRYTPDFSSRFRILKGGRISLVVSAFLAGTTITFAAPSGGEVTNGIATINQNGSVTTINQATSKASINWQNFSIGKTETVNFSQPSASSITLNRVIGNEKSIIEGALNANGQVWILNSNGVLFGKSASVNTAGLLATTKDISNENFMSGNYSFSGQSSGSVINMGEITITDKGYAALLADSVKNEGVIRATLGDVYLKGAAEYSLNLNGNSMINISVTKSKLDSLVENKGAIIADGGEVYLTTSAAEELMHGVVNNTGTIQASSMQEKDGKIVLFAHGGEVNAGGILDASAPHGGNGGFIETSGDYVYIAEDIVVTTAAKDGKTGEWLIDPYDIVVASSGGHISGATLATALNSTNVTLDTTNATATGVIYAEVPTEGNGNITVNDTIIKTGSNVTTLTLKAHNDININEEIKSTGGRLNIVLTADQDNSGSGDVNFGSLGKITTNNGNFYVGSVSGSYDTVTATAQNFTMATGSFIDVGSGNLDIKVKNNITLADNSAQTNTYSLIKSRLFDQSNYVYFNTSQLYYYQLGNIDLYPKISLTAGGSILGGNANNAKADIVTAGRVVLSANGDIGSSTIPIKIEGSERAGTSHTITNDLYNPFPSYAQSLSVTNTLGSTYIAEINKQIFGSISLNVGSSTNGLQSINIMNDARNSGNGHIMATANSGILSVASDGINTKGVKRTNDDPNNFYDDYDYNADSLAVYSTSVSLSAPTIELADNAIVSNSVNYRRVSGSSTWSYTHVPTLSLSGTNILASDTAKINGTSEISGFGTVYLSGPNIGSTTNAPEISTGTLSIDNTGGNTYLANAFYGSLLFDGRNVVGIHHVLSSNGDFFNVKTGQDVNSDSTLDGLLVETISGTSNGSNWGTSTGIHTATAFDPTGNNNQGSGITRNVSLSTRTGGIIFSDNSINVGGADFTVSIPNNSSGEGRLIRSLNPYNAATPVAQITAGNVYLNNYVNSISTPISMGGGEYHIQIARGSGTAREDTLGITSTAGEINVHELTQNHFKTISTTLNGSNVAQNILIDLAGEDHIQYSDSGSRILLDAQKIDIDSYNRNWNFNATSRHVQLGALSNGGTVANTLGTGYYTVNTNRLYLDSDVLSDGSALRLTGSQIDLMRNVRIDSNADDLQNSNSVGNSGSIYLSGQISGASADRKIVIDSSSDTISGGMIYMYSTLGNNAGHYLSDFRMTSKGSTDTNDGGVYFYGSSYLLDGNFHVTGNTFLNYGGTFDTEQGNTKDAGNITFDGYRLTTYSNYNNIFNTATTANEKNGGDIDLYNTYLKSQLLSSNFTIDARGGTDGESGSIYLPSISTTAYTNRFIDIKGGDIFLYGNLSTNWGAVTLAGNTQLANSLIIDTWSSTNNQQTATAGSVTINGALSAVNTNTILTIDTSTDTGTPYFNTSNQTPFTHNAGAITINTQNIDSGVSLSGLLLKATKSGTYNNGVQAGITASGATVDTLAVAGASSVSFDNGDHTLEIGMVGGVSGITSTGKIEVSTQSGDLTLNGNIATTATVTDAIILNAGKSTDFGTATGGNIIHTSGIISTGENGRATLYSGSIADSTGLDTLIGSGSGRFRYNSDESTTNYTTELENGLYAIYREQPTIQIVPDEKTINYGENEPDFTYTLSGFVNGDAEDIISGIPIFTVGSISLSAGSHDIVYSTGLSNGLGYLIADNSSVTNELTVIATTVTTPQKNTVLINGEEKNVQSVAGEQTTAIVNNTTLQTPRQIPENDTKSTPVVVMTSFGGSQSGIQEIGGKQVFISSTPMENEATKTVTMTELIAMQEVQEPKEKNVEDIASTLSDIRIALSDTSIITLVNGGVKLPDGAEQQFYVVDKD